MNLAVALLRRLLDDAAVTAIVATRIHWVTRPQGGTLPALVLQQISEDRPRHLDGYDDMRSARVQVAALSESFGEARALLDAAIAALDDEAEVAAVAPDTGTALFWAADLAGIRDTAEDVAGGDTVHRTLADLIIRYTIDA